VPVVFVHGVPEKPALWDRVRAELGRDDTVALALPGFDGHRPDGFEATKERYVEWLVTRLEAFGEPVDLVGHDWGGGLTIRLASLRSDLLRSWVSDALYLVHEDYRWHRYAVRWQTPGVGERDVRAQLDASVADRAAPYERWGLDPQAAALVASWLDAPMAGAILDLYRSAVTVSREWAGDMTGITAPGLTILPTEDPFADAPLVRAVAEAHGVALATLEGLGHWWMLQDPTGAAATLTSFWASVAR
jgi:pimeloyl-ACP methyl ester carboxylesterase